MAAKAPGRADREGLSFMELFDMFPKRGRGCRVV